MSVVLDDAVFQQRISRLAAAIPRELAGALLRDESKQFVRQVVKFLPPKTLSQGQRAVARDVNRTMRILDPEAFRSKSIRKLLATGSLAAIREFTSRVPKLKGLTVAEFSPTLHTTKRNAYGRVSPKTRPTLLHYRDKAALGKYVETVQARVGYLKSGYNPAASGLGLTLPGWIRKVPNVGQGALRIAIGKPVGMQEIVITNRAGRYRDHPRVVRDALRSRTKAIRTKTFRLLNNKATNLGFATYDPRFTTFV